MTPERIRRHDDEHLYQPRIHSRRIRELYRVSEETGEPMTVLVDQAIADFIDTHAQSVPEAPTARATDPRVRASRELP